MKRTTKIFLIVLVSMQAYSCTVPDKKEKNEKTVTVDSIKTDSLRTSQSFSKNQHDFIHLFNLSDRDSTVATGKLISEDIFTFMQITSGADTLYTVDENGLFNRVGIDFRIDSESFYGYRISYKGEDYMVFHLLKEEGRSVSDDLTIKYDSSRQSFKVLIQP